MRNYAEMTQETKHNRRGYSGELAVIQQGAELMGVDHDCLRIRCADQFARTRLLVFRDVDCSSNRNSSRESDRYTGETCRHNCWYIFYAGGRRLEVLEQQDA